VAPCVRFAINCKFFGQPNKVLPNLRVRPGLRSAERGGHQRQEYGALVENPLAERTKLGCLSYPLDRRPERPDLQSTANLSREHLTV
jgi:hypothetical protein